MARQARAAALAVVLAALAACSAETTSGAPDVEAREVEVPPASFTAEPGAPLEGRFYAVVGGETSNDNQLYELGFAPPALRLLTPTRRVSAVGACTDAVVVAAGQEEVGFSDHIQRLEGDRLVPVEGLGPSPGFSPALDAGCRIAYTWVDRSAEALVDEVRIWDPATQSGTTLYRAEPGDGPLVSVSWGPEGQLAVARQGPGQADQLPAGTPPGRPAALVLLGADGEVREIGLDGVPGVVSWGKDWIAVAMNDQPNTVLVSPATDARSTLAGWRPLTWSPDGERLLVKDATERRKLGVVEAGDLASVRTVGQANGPVIDVDWLAPQ